MIKDSAICKMTSRAEWQPPDEVPPDNSPLEFPLELPGEEFPSNPPEQEPPAPEEEPPVRERLLRASQTGSFPGVR